MIFKDSVLQSVWFETKGNRVYGIVHGRFSHAFPDYFQKCMQFEYSCRFRLRPFSKIDPKVIHTGKLRCEVVSFYGHRFPK